jgi:hypothetical protein
MASVEPLHHVVRGAVARFERGHPVVDAFVVDARDCRGVVRRGIPRLHFPVSSFTSAGTL